MWIFRVKKLTEILVFNVLLCGGLTANGIVYLEIFSGTNPHEISWTLANIEGEILFSDEGKITETNKLYKFELAVSPASCAVFEIHNVSGLGIVNGYYSIERSNLLYADAISEFEDSNIHYMGACGLGVDCSNAVPVSSRLMLYKLAFNYWYVIEKQTDTYYDINTCYNYGLDTRMWIYDHCPDELKDGPEGALAFDEETSRCSPGSGFKNALFEAGKKYYVRIAILGDYEEDYIGIDFIAKSENYGCTDPKSCNYNPLANRDDGSCIYDPTCKPDLIIDEVVFRESIFLDIYIVTDTCLIDEKCVTGIGERSIIRFTTAVSNIGQADYVVGYPEKNEIGFSIDNCHEHWHHLGYAEYLLYAGSGAPEPIGFKNGFCVQDSDCDSGTVKYSCGYMGITAGCHDVYTSDIDCQWIDVTKVPDGEYTMVARINWSKYPDARGMEELDYTNNWAQVCIRLDRSSGELVLTKLDNCSVYNDCLGIPFGSSVLDCSGVCGGSSHFGDINDSGEINQTDLASYLDLLTDKVNYATSCTDLDGNDALTIYDVCLLHECLESFNGADPLHSHCLFPAGINNISAEASISIADHDPIEKSININILSEQEDLRAFQFQISGIDQILSVENLTGIDFQIHSNPSNEIFALMENLVLPKSTNVLPLLKIYYDKQIEEEICIPFVTDIVSASYQKILGTVEYETCVFYSETSNSEKTEVLKIYPNPVGNVFTVELNGEGITRLDFLTCKGDLIQTIKFKSSYKIYTKDLSAGIYFVKLSTNDNNHVRKILVK